MYGRTKTQTIQTARGSDSVAKKCYESTSYCTPPDTNVIDFETLYDELMLHACH